MTATVDDYRTSMRMHGQAADAHDSAATAFRIIVIPTRVLAAILATVSGARSIPALSAAAGAATFYAVLVVRAVRAGRRAQTASADAARWDAEHGIIL